MYKNYTEWAHSRDPRLKREWADFGFSMQKDDYKRYKDDDQQPIDPLDVQEVFGEIMRMPPINSYRPRQRFSDTIEWGNELGAVLLDISPLGSFKSTIRRKITNLQGEVKWICKRVHPLIEEAISQNEIAKADDLYKEVVAASKGMIDSAAPEYDEWKTLVRHLYTKTRLQFPSYCMFAPKIKQMNENYFKIYFGMKGHGVEAPSASRVEQFDIDLLFDKEKGLIRCWGYDINSPTKGHKWAVQPSEWDEWFAPTQPIDEIVEAIINNLMVY